MENWEREAWKAHREQLQELKNARDKALAALQQVQVHLAELEGALYKTIAEGFRADVRSQAAVTE